MAAEAEGREDFRRGRRDPRPASRLTTSPRALPGKVVDMSWRLLSFLGFVLGSQGPWTNTSQAGLIDAHAEGPSASVRERWGALLSWSL